MSVDHYVRLEQGLSAHFSEAVLDAVAGALDLDDAERAHLYSLARPGAAGSESGPIPPQQVRPGLRRLLDSVRHILTPVAGGTRVTHQLVIDGPAADTVDPELGPQISAAFAVTMQSLFAAARRWSCGQPGLPALAPDPALVERRIDVRDTRAKVLSVIGTGKALAIEAIECVEAADAGFFTEYPASLVAALKRTGN